jgi:hypothetical protein
VEPIATKLFLAIIIMLSAACRLGHAHQQDPWRRVSKWHLHAMPEASPPHALREWRLEVQGPAGLVQQIKHNNNEEQPKRSGSSTSP